MADNVIVRVPEQQFIRGEDGYSPEVTIENIDHGHRITITDREHPEGQTADVLDGDSAYEQAVAGGYTGTEAQFNEELASFKELSEQAADSAQQAASGASTAQYYMNSAWNAVNSANLAKVSAESAAAQALIRMNSADASAQAAAGSAGDASTAATTATTKAGEASDSATAADGSAKDSEAYAVGKRGGTDVGSADPAYHNNAKYYAEQAALIVNDVEQVMTSTTIGPVAIATFDASAADMPLKGLTVNIEPVQSGSGDPSPDNVRPITGWTGCNILQYPENLLNVNDIRTGRITSDGDFNIDTTTRCATLVFIPVAQNANYTIATNVGVQCIAVHYYSAGNTESWLYRDAVSGQITAFTTPANCSFIRVMFAKDNTSTSITPSDITTAIIMRGNTYSITFPSEAGTVYGGTLTVNADGTGKISIDRAELVLTPSMITGYGSYQQSYYLQFGNLPVSFKGSQIELCDRYPIINAGANTGIRCTGVHSLYIYDQTFTSRADAETWLSNNPVHVIYPLVEAVEVTIPSGMPEIITLLGTNNIWANCGDVTVTYGAYLEAVKAYADKVGNSILSAIAPLETSYTASRAYTVGSFLFVGTKFYKVTAAIASGDTITPDTNVTQTTIAEQLMALANV